MSQQNNKSLIVFLDTIGRTLIAKVNKETETIVSVENPAIVHVQPNPQTNQLQLQILPLFFKEFQEDKTQPTVWHFNKSSITLSDSIALAPQFAAQYEQLNQAYTKPAEQPNAKADIVKLFDEEEEPKS